MQTKNTPSPTRVPVRSYHNIDDLDDPYKYQTKSPISVLTPDTMLTNTSIPPNADAPSSLLNRQPTSESFQQRTIPLSQSTSSVESSGLHSRSTNTQYSTELSDFYEECTSPLRSSGGKLPYPDDPVIPASVQPPYPVTPPPRSPTKAGAPPYPNPAYSDPLSSFSLSQSSHRASDPFTNTENPLKKAQTTIGHNNSFKTPRLPLKTIADGDSVNSLDTIANVPRSQSTVGYEGRLSLPSRSYTVGSRSHSGSGPTISGNSLRSSSYSTADDSLMLRLDLPAIPDSKVQFDASKLSSKDFEQCKTPWLISSLSSWIQQYATQRDMTFEELSEALIGLFRHTVPTLGWVAAERVTVPLLESLTRQKFISVDKSTGLVIVDGTVSPTGVLPTLSNKGCYSSKSHSYDKEDSSCTNYRCYSSRCWRSLPYKAVLPEMERALQMDDSDRLNWGKLWRIPDEEVAKMDKKVIERQSAIHELIATEETYVRGLKIFLSIYGESLARVRPAIFPQQKKFWDNTFGCIQGLIDCNGAQFLSHLKARQSQQGPFIDNIADLIMNWLKVARVPYINRANTYSFSYRVMVSEKSKNEAFSHWLASVEHDPRVSRQQKFDFLISSPFTRMCKYNLLFGRIKDSTPPEHPDYQLLDRCMEECKSILNEYNVRHGEAEDLSSILTLDEKIEFRSAEEKVDLRLSEGRRKIVYESNVLRKGEFGIDFVDTHMILLDHYLIMAKVRKEHVDKYLVSKKPIALDLLVVEEVNGEPVAKSKTNHVVGVLATAGNNADPRRMSRLMNPTSPISNKAGVDYFAKAPRATASENANMIFPIKLRDLGLNRKTYYIYTNTEEERKTWVDKILTAKREYSSSVYALNAEPFRLQVVEDSYFGYDSSAPKLPVFSQATALDRAIQEYEQQSGTPEKKVVLQSKVNATASFTFGGKQFTIVGLNNGLYVRDESRRVWERCLELSKISQLEVLTDYNVLLVLSDRTLVYYNLDQILSIAVTQAPGGVRRTGRDSNIAGFALSRPKEVSYFSTGYMVTGPSEKRQLLFYKCKDMEQPLKKTSILEVMEPIKERGSQNRRSQFVSKSVLQTSTEYFSHFDSVVIPGETYGITLFSSTFCVHSTKGFELMLLSYKSPKLIPDFSSIGTILQRSAALNSAAPTSGNGSPGVATENLKRRLETSKPIGTFLISDNQILLCYDTFAIFCDKFACMSSPLVVNFLCKIKNAAVIYPYLITFSEELVEVRKLDRECRLKQVITGKDITLSDGKDGQVTIALAHPKYPGRQLIVELVNNEFVVEDDNSSLAGL